VYLGFDPVLNRQVALKVPRAEMVVTAGLRERFQREARMASGLNHPHVVAVYESGQVGPVCFIVTAFCPGITLADWLKERTEPVAFPAAAQLMATLAEAVHYAHQKGIVHRDLKPANVLLGVDESGKVETGSNAKHADVSLDSAQITDFGLAKNVFDPEPEELTRSGAILGTVNYMAPEQAAGQGRDAGLEADVYSLGAILYELLTRRPPFRGATDLDTLQMIRFEEPVSPERIRPEVPRDLATICLKCLAKDGAKRFASAQELAEDLRRYLADLPILARRSTLREQIWRQCRRNPASSLLAVIVALLLVVLAIASQLAARRFEEQRDRAVAAERATKKELLSSYVIQARSGHRGGGSGRRFDTLDTLEAAMALRHQISEVAGIPSTLDLRNAAIGSLTLADLRLERQWEGYPAGSDRIAFAPDFERYVRTDNQGRLFLCRAGDGRELSSLPQISAPVKYLLFSPDSRLVAFIRDDRGVQLWDLERKTCVRPELPAIHEWAIAFDRRGRRIAVGHDDGVISLYDTVTAQTVSTLRFAAGVASEGLVFDPDGQWLAAYRRQTSDMQLGDMESDRVVAVIPFRHAATSVGSSADGRRAAIGCQDGHIHVWDVRNHVQMRELAGHREVVDRVAMDATGTLVASTSWDGTLRLWDAVSGRELFRAAAEVRDLRFSGDGLWLAASVRQTKLGLWRVADGREHRALSFIEGPQVHALEDCSVSPDGRMLAVAAGDGAHLWDLATRAQLGIVPAGPTISVAFLPGGGELLTAGGSGLSRWQIAPPVDRAAAMTFEAGEKLLASPVQHLSLSGSNGLLAAAVANRGVSVFSLADLPCIRPVHAHPGTVYSAVSRTGRWVAAGTWYGRGVRAWDVESGTSSDLVKEDRMNTVSFSIDDRWLVTGGIHEFCFWETGTWQLRWRMSRDGGGIPGAVAFAPSGRIVALQTGPSQIRFHEPISLQDLCTLDVPDGDRVKSMAFLPNDSRFVAVASSDDRIHVWDLALIRNQLAALGLDWEDANAMGSKRPD
jgi:WD40 repeat protein/tRNA A-37 threonylcarbamoyl transferase component Bud32